MRAKLFTDDMLKGMFVFVDAWTGKTNSKNKGKHHFSPLKYAVRKVNGKTKQHISY